ncbi:MAG: hypothetical protein HN796_09245, partial [Gemmatimonadetes bacterium]|nr:hypothetical protein [Gemmatimonadota bacterium]
MTKAIKRSVSFGISFSVFLCCLLIAGPSTAQPFFTEVPDEAFLGPRLSARGVAFGDYDNDGRPDLFLPEGFLPQWANNRIALWHNEGNHRFVHQNDEIQADFYNSKFKGAGSAWGDYDNDGDQDIFVSVGAWFSTHRSQNLLLRNDRGIFHDVASAAGLTDVLPTDNAIWLDYNRDGFLDLYVAGVGFGIDIGSDGWFLTEDDPSVRNKLYHNNGDGTFADVTASMGLDIQFQPDAGGTNGGVLAADVNDDGWPDLYVASFDYANRLFLSDGQGGFQEVNSGVIADEGEAHNVASGDINNDGHLDIIMAAGGGGGSFRSQMLLNLGDGQFLDVLDASGLSALGSGDLRGPGLADFDNDGDLDLLTARPHFLFLNDGDGLFVDQTSQSGIKRSISTSVSIGDYDGDGFLDVVASQGRNPSPPYRLLFNNTGNANHWLRVDLVGIESNRGAIGARLVTRSGDLQQIREISGGTGYEQNERIVHFGLANATMVDRLEIRWPSGQVDELTDIPADQTIRVLEGRSEWYPVVKTEWETPPPASVISGEQTDLSVVVRPALFEPTATITSIAADLSRLGGPESVALQAVGDGTYRLDHTMTIGGQSDHGDMEVVILQETSLGEHWINLSRRVEVLAPATAVLEDHDAAIPDAFALSQNYPNPFNPETTIRFDLPTSGDAELSLFNLSGQRVATLISGLREAGSYTLHWDGRDD